MMSARRAGLLVAVFVGVLGLGRHPLVRGALRGGPDAEA
jgi:hypothetical protein